MGGSGRGKAKQVRNVHGKLPPLELSKTQNSMIARFTLWEKTLAIAPFPGHAPHEKGLQKHKGVVPLVGSRAKIALLVPVINRCRTGDETRFNRKFCSAIPGHALHEKGLHEQKCVVPLVGSQEQKKLLVLLINR